MWKGGLETGQQLKIRLLWFNHKYWLAAGMGITGVENGIVTKNTKRGFFDYLVKGQDVKKENDTANGDGRRKSKANGVKGVYHLETCMFHF